MRLGLETKLILCFMSVLCAATGVTCVVFISQTRGQLSEVTGEQARQVAMAMSLTSERMYRAGDWSELRRRGQELIKSRNIAYVGFLDANARAKVLASRDIDLGPEGMTINLQRLMQVTPRRSPALGDCQEVVAPILSLTSPAGSSTTAEKSSRLLGYVVVGVSQMPEDVQIYRIYYLVVGIACAMAILSLPVAYILVHRVFLPIRLLVAVTRQIATGDLETRVEIYRPDIIGDLARSFDEMVTRVKSQQQDLARANQGLEQKVEQRTSQLETANNRLIAEIMEKEEFLRAVSHDLNAPLRNISGMVTMLLNKSRSQLDEEAVHRLQRIKSNVEVQTDLISELLELSRIKTRRQKMERVDTGAVVSDLKLMFENDLRERSIQLIVDSPLPELNAERSRIRQVFQNLIDNAIKYMGAGPTREIHIGCEVFGTEAEFYVRDTGIGIDPEDRDRVFSVFRRGRNSAAQHVVGKGVGLASVKSIVETYNGKIWLASHAGQGSTFRFTINGKFLPQPDGRAAA